MTRLNDLGQPIGEALPDWTPPPVPARAPLTGRWASLEPLDPARHSADLFAAIASDAARRHRWLFDHAPGDPEALRDWAEGAEFDALLARNAASADPMFFALRSAATGRAEGWCSLMRITPGAGTIEVGWIWWGPRMQRTPAATEAIFLLMREVFGLGYRRFEWKCDTLNAASRAAAMRFGFSYEGVFRQAVVYKGRSRDTAWYAMIDKEAPALERAYAAWLDPANFDEADAQKRRLADLTAPVLVARG